MNDTNTKVKPPPPPANMLEFFPLKTVRDKQAKCFDFLQRMIARGVSDIIISAPTGVGKSVIGATAAFWSAQKDVFLPGTAGAYYLCTQKLLQDQLENDIAHYPPGLKSAVSLKTASEYPCAQFGDCNTGRQNKKCEQAKARLCTYALQKAAFLNAALAITNYPYFFTERTHLRVFPARKLLIADECHTLENQIMGFVEVVLDNAQVEKFTPTLHEVPELPTLEDYAFWLESSFLPVMTKRLEGLGRVQLNPKEAKEKQEIELKIEKVKRAVKDFADYPSDWVYWQDLDTASGVPRYTCIAKPMYVNRFFKDLVVPTASCRIYMSAYPGSKDIFCRSLGLDAERTAMLHLGSSFPAANRPIHVLPLGSMSKRNIETSLPSFLRVMDKTLAIHAREKGIVHCNSYALGEAIYQHFSKSPHGPRLLFPRKAEEREEAYNTHIKSKEPTVVLSPSFTEGFDFFGDRARWQILAKIPYPYLGDKRVAAKKEVDPEWYGMRTVMTIIQASGRICRSETDHGVTYITDGDFAQLYSKFEYMFPGWWKEALQWA